MPRSFSDRIAASLDHPVDAAWACRPRWTTRISPVGAGIGARIGSIVGGSPLWAGVGAGPEFAEALRRRIAA